jgi:hypothetical protein
MKIHKVKIANINNEADIHFIIDVFLSKESNLIWGGNDFFAFYRNKTEYEKIDLFTKKIIQEWGKFDFFKLYENNIAQGLFALYNISTHNQRADFFVWIDSNARKKLVLIKWWITFLNLIRREYKINRLFCRIKESNTIALENAQRFDFKITGVLPEYFVNSNQKENVIILTRSTILNTLEVNFLPAIPAHKKYINNQYVML